MKDAKQSIGPFKTWKQLRVVSENAVELGWETWKLGFVFTSVCWSKQVLFLYQSLSEVMQNQVSSYSVTQVKVAL